MDIEELAKQVAIANERIDKLRKESLAYTGIVWALIHSHPDPQALRQALVSERERFQAMAIASPVSDDQIDWIVAQVDKWIDHLG